MEMGPHKDRENSTELLHFFFCVFKTTLVLFFIRKKGSISKTQTFFNNFTFVEVVSDHFSRIAFFFKVKTKYRYNDAKSRKTRNAAPSQGGTSYNENDIRRLQITSSVI